MYNGLRKGELCPKCKREMERRCHRENESAYLKLPYHYVQWDYCKHCKHVQHYEKFKRYRQNSPDEKLRFDEVFNSSDFEAQNQ